MMVVKKLMAAKFGGLVDKKLNLKNGLNIVYGPNEAGKTSWADLFDVLMYGVPRKTAKARNDFDRNVYYKYDMDAGINVGATINIDGEEFTFNKVNSKACEVKNSELINVPEWCSKTPGEILFGVNHDTFLQTAFLKQMQPFIDKNAELERKIATLVQTVGTNDGVAYSEADRALEEVLRQLTSKTRQNSILPALYEKRDLLERDIANGRETYAEIEEISNKIKQVEKLLEGAKHTEKSREIAQAKELVDEVVALEAEKQKLLNALGELKVVLEHNGNMMDDVFFDQYRLALDDVKFARKEVDSAEKEREKAISEKEYLDKDKIQYAFFEDSAFSLKNERITMLKNALDDEAQTVETTELLNKEITDIEGKINNLNQQLNSSNLSNESADIDTELSDCEEQYNKHDKMKKTRRVIGGILMVLGLVSAPGIALDLSFVIPMALLLIIGLVIFMTSNKPYKGETPEQMRRRIQENYALKAELQKTNLESELSTLNSQLLVKKQQIDALMSNEEFAAYRAEFNELLDSAGCINYVDYKRKHERFIEFTAAYALNNNNANQRAEIANIKAEKLKTAEEKFVQLAHQFGIKVENEVEAEAKLNQLRAKYREYAEIEGLLRVCSDKILTRLNGKTLDAIKEVAAQEVTIIDGAEDNYTQTEIDEMNLQLQELQRQLGVLRGSLSNMSELDVLLAEKDECSAQIEHFEAEEEAVKLAKEFLKLANDDFEQFFAPKLNEATADIFSKITGGRYESVGIDRAFNIKVSAKDGMGVFDSSSVSEGTMEQVLFSLRLALVDSVYAKENMPPMFIDDAFVNFDDERCRLAMNLLAEIVNDMQIVYFTCKQEIVDVAKALNANIITHSNEWAMC